MSPSFFGEKISPLLEEPQVGMGRQNLFTNLGPQNATME